jgi:5'-nucleotidase (lipoprotein e(P4) family)
MMGTSDFGGAGEYRRTRPVFNCRSGHRRRGERRIGGMMPRWVPFLVLSVAVACRATAPSGPPVATLPPAPGTSVEGGFKASKAVRWVRESAERRALFVQVFRAAATHVESAAATRAPGSWAVVADADETLIDNSLYQVERERAGRGFTPESWRAWTERQAAIPIPGAAPFLTRVRALGGRIAVVTNRRQSECPDTEAVFRTHGLAYDVMLCRGDDGPSDKTPRFESVARGTTPAGLPPLEILAFLGDNIRDFPEGSQDLRTASDEALAGFGARFFVVPNPMYGSWE